MKTPYLIQRGKFILPAQTNKTGIDNIVRWDYMGSSEFEWGALPNALAIIKKNISKYAMNVVKIPNRDVSVCIFCTAEQFKQISEEFLPNLIKKSYRLKERCYIGDVVNPSDSPFASKFPNKFWWDIENDYFFWINDEQFNAEFKKVFNIK